VGDRRDLGLKCPESWPEVWVCGPVQHITIVYLEWGSVPKDQGPRSGCCCYWIFFLSSLRERDKNKTKQIFFFCLKVRGSATLNVPCGSYHLQSLQGDSLLLLSLCSSSWVEVCGSTSCPAEVLFMLPSTESPNAQDCQASSPQHCEPTANSFPVCLSSLLGPSLSHGWDKELGAINLNCILFSGREADSRS
jgi:hypothetical protein